MTTLWKGGMLRTCLAAIFIAISQLLPAQTYFRNFSVSDGLSNNTVKSIAFDMDGFLWVGTEDGLNRYDGKTFETVLDFPEELLPVYNEYVSALLTDSRGTLWVGTSSGLFYKPRHASQFSMLEVCDSEGAAFRPDVLSITEDKHGRIWFSTFAHGIICLEREDFSLRVMSKTLEGDEMLYVPQVYADSDGNVWAAVRRSGSRLMHYDEINGGFTPFGADRPVPDILCICEDSYNNLWLGTWDRGVLKFNPRTRKLTSVITDLDKVLHVHSLVEYRKNVIAIGSDKGLTLWDENSQTGTTYNHLESSMNSLSNDYIYPLVTDKEGGLWIGTYYGGVNYLSPSAQQIRHFEYSGYSPSVSGNIISALCEDASQRIWIGSDDGGVDCYDPATNSFLKTPQTYRSLNVHALCAEGNTIWIGAYDGGLHRYDTRSGAMKVYTRAAAPENADCSSVYSICCDNSGTVWVGTMFGILSYDRGADVFRQRLGETSLVIDISEDIYGDLWFATQSNGLYRYRRAEDEFVNYNLQNGQLPSNQVNCLVTATGNEIYIGTSKGIVCHNLADGSFRQLEAKIPSDNVCYMVKNLGRMWVSTTTGLAYWDIFEGSWHNFTSFDEGAGAAYLIGSGLVSSSNELYLGTTKGFDVLSLSKLISNEVVPQVRISGIRAGDSEYGYDDLACRIASSEPVRMKSTDQNLQIHLYSNSFVNPVRNVYRYMMDGFEKEWNYTSDPHGVTYGKLPPGRYVFRVRAANNDGVWSDNEEQIRFIVRAPLMLSSVAVLLYVIIFLGFIFLCFWTYFRHKDMLRRERLSDLQRQKDMELYAEKLNFFTMVAHEIRTPASLILAPLENAMELEQSDKMRANLEVISKNCHSMLDMINQLLDYKKVENGAFAIKRSVFDFCPAVKNIVSGYAVTAESGRLRFVCSTDELPSSLLVNMDRGALERILNNLLTNAFKYCKSSIDLRFAYDVQTDLVTISIKDDGIGISEDNISNIFKPFFRENEFNQTGTGIGLFLVKHLVESHGGEVTVVSAKDQGSEFVVTLPARSKEALSEQLTGVEESSAEPASDVIPLQPLKSSGKLAILVVEDNPQLRAFLEDSLKDTYDVLTAGDGVEALKLLQSRPVSLIISDVMMPNMDGMELCRQVHAKATLSHIPIILLTAKTDLGTHVEGLENNADAFIEKPFSLKLLKSQIQNLLQSRELLMKKFANWHLGPYKREEAGPEAKAEDPFWESLNRHMEKNLDNPDYSVSQLAEDMCMSRTKLFAHFKEVSDKTPMELMQHYRLKKAASLLLTGDHKVSEVAYMVGFKDPSYFTKCFIRHFGMTPMSFVQRAQAGDNKNAGGK